MNALKTARPVVYVCSPYKGDTAKNTERARDYCRYAVDQGCTPIAMHLLLPQYIDESTQRQLAMLMDLQMLKRCDELWAFGGVVTSGMQKEIEEARRLGMRIRYVTEDELCTR